MRLRHGYPTLCGQSDSTSLRGCAFIAKDAGGPTVERRGINAR
jgi:hypothetical protein